VADHALGAIILNHSDVFSGIFSHRKGAKDAEANEKKTTLCALCVFAVKLKITKLKEIIRQKGSRQAEFLQFLNP
jgi:hypothetical protein